MLKSLIGALVAAFALCCATTPAEAAPRYREYVALGDSWSADVVLADSNGLPDSTHVPLGCFQSHRNYPKLLAAALQVPTFRDASCGSATTDHFSGPQEGLPTGETNAPQFARLTATTDLVTVGIGGNDAGFASGAVSCINILPTNTNAFDAITLPVDLPLLGSGVPLGGCKQRFVKDGRDLLAESIAASEPKLVRALEEIHRRSPKALVFMIDYLDAIPAKGCYPLVPITDEDMAYLHETFKKLNAMVRRAAAKGGAHFVDSYADSPGRDVCQPPHIRYVEGLGILSVNDVAIAVPAHPNSAGAAQQFRSMLETVTSVESARSCAGRPVQPKFVGTSGPDRIVGTSGNDVINAGAGSDTVFGGGGNDVICGLDGNDSVIGGAGNDILYGGSGNDNLVGEVGVDNLVGGTGADRLSGGDGYDRVFYSDHSSAVVATIGNGKRDDGNGSDGPAGARDNISSTVEGLFGSAGADRLTGNGAANVLSGLGGNDTLRGSLGKDHLVGGTGADSLYGDADNDSLNANDGARDTRLDGGSGTDTVRRDSNDPAPISVP